MNSLNEICFLCLVQSKSLKSILIKDNDGVAVEDKLKCFFPELILFKPEIPKFICVPCLDSTNFVYKFRQHCLQSIITLSEYLQKLSMMEEAQSHFLAPFIEEHCRKQRKIARKNLNKDKIDEPSCSVKIKTEKSDSEDSSSSDEEETEKKYEIEDVVVKKEPEEIPEDDVEYEILEKTGKETKKLDSSSNSDKIDLRQTYPINLTFSPDIKDQKELKFKCKECNKLFRTSHHLKVHSRMHTGKRPYPCEVCNKSFKQQPHLKAHERTHSGVRPYVCDICQKSFTLVQHLKTHLHIHTGVRPHECDVCHKRFTEKCTLKVHKRIHERTEPYKCTQCERSFRVASNLSRHLKLHEDNRYEADKPYACPVCNKRFTKSRGLVKHKRKIHGIRSSRRVEVIGKIPPAEKTLDEEIPDEKSLEKSVEEKDSDEEGSTDKGETLEPDCDLQSENSNSSDEERKDFDVVVKKETEDTSENAEDVQMHFLSEGMDLEEEEDANEDDVNSDSQDQDPNFEEFKCSICSKILSTKRALRIHTRIHSGDRPYKCQTCNKTFKQLYHLKVHDLCHTGEKAHKCEICSKQFYTMPHLTRHRRIHSNERPYQCKQCNKSFTESGNLGRHLRTHTGEKRYECHICQKSFTYSDVLKKHIRIHLGHKPFSCDLCDMKFFTSFHLQTHRKVHENVRDYECQFCGKIFKAQHHLTMHMMTHGIRPPNMTQKVDKDGKSAEKVKQERKETDIESEKEGTKDKMKITNDSEDEN